MEKITSEEAYLEYLKQLGSYDDAIVLQMNRYGWAFYSNTYFNITWWAKREQARLAYGVYKCSEVLRNLNKFFPIFSHVSLDDPKLVAFTPDAHCGENDKQIRITLGKLISKYLPVITQKCLQQMIIDHDSEMNPEILWASGDELTYLYQNMGGTGACMSKSTWDVHPTVAYHTDEIKLAYIKKGETIVARTLVYEPKDKSKKVFIRMYPKGHALETHLRALGYVPGNFVGAKLNTVRINKKDQYALPYLDADNSLGSTSSSTTALIDGQITVVSKEIQNAIYKLYPGEHSKLANYTANGYAYFENIKSSEFNQTCIISGETYSLLNDVHTEYVFVDGKYGNALNKNIPDHWIQAKVLGTRNTAFTDKSNVVKIDIEYYIVKDTNYLIEHNYRQLDKDFYPEASDYWTSKYLVTFSGKIIKTLDAVEVHHYDGKTITTRIFYKNEIKPRDYLKLVDGSLCTKDSKYLTTTSNKRVIPEINHYYTLIDGTHTIRRPKAFVIMYDVSYYGNSYQEIREYVEKNRDELYKEYLLKVISKNSIKRAARILLERNWRVSQKAEDESNLTVEKILNYIILAYMIGTTERKVATNYLAELTAVEY